MGLFFKIEQRVFLLLLTQVISPRVENQYSGQTSIGRDVLKKANEASIFAALDVCGNTAVHLNAVQMPPLPQMTLLDFYCELSAKLCSFFILSFPSFFVSLLHEEVRLYST